MALIGDRVLGVAAVQLVSDKANLVTEVFLPCPAVSAMPTGEAQPGHTDTVPNGKSLYELAFFYHGSDNFVARD
jgi:hypothetical protein